MTPNSDIKRKSLLIFVKAKLLFLKFFISKENNINIQIINFLSSLSSLKY